MTVSRYGLVKGYGPLECSDGPFVTYADYAALEADRQWKPIESAPNDGEFLCWIVDLPWPCIARDGHIRSRAHGLLNEPGDMGGILEATHWMPLPEKP